MARVACEGLPMAKTLRTLDDLKPAPYNPRTITKDAASGLSASLEEFGDLSGVTWNKRTGHMVTAHQRLTELRKLGATLDVDGGEAWIMLPNGGGFLVRIVDWPIEKEKRANVAANNQHIAGEFTDGLPVVLDDIRAASSDEQFTALRFDVLAGPGVEVEDFSDLDGEADSLEPLHDQTIFITVPREHVEAVIEWILDGKGSRTSGQLGIGLMKRCGLL